VFDSLLNEVKFEGKITVDDLYFGAIKSGEEKKLDAIIAIMATMESFFH
jgi:hypothetical protein